MKKGILYTILLTSFVLVLYGCSKEVTLIGSWDHNGYVYTFNEDNTCNYDALGNEMKCTYTAEGDKLSILYDGMSAPFETTYRIEDNVLHIIDSFGSEVNYNRK